jgi:hypothetical protein
MSATPHKLKGHDDIRKRPLRGLGELNAEFFLVGPRDPACLSILASHRQFKLAGYSVRRLDLQTGTGFGNTSNGAWHLTATERNFS